MKENDDISKIYSVYSYFKNDEMYSKILEFKKDDSNLSKKLVDIIYSNEFKTSISKLELYKKCPFSYFMQYIYILYIFIFYYFSRHPEQTYISPKSQTNTALLCW